jgi:hypothetical protein
MKHGISLFVCVGGGRGVGDLALKSAGVHILVANDLLPDRA